MWTLICTLTGGYEQCEGTADVGQIFQTGMEGRDRRIPRN